jgi:hypothetical protein
VGFVVDQVALQQVSSFLVGDTGIRVVGVLIKLFNSDVSTAKL